MVSSLTKAVHWIFSCLGLPSRGWFRSIDLWVMGPARFRCPTLLYLGLGLGLWLDKCLCLTALLMTSMVRDRGKCTGRRLSSNEPSELWFAFFRLQKLFTQQGINFVWS